MCVRSMAVRVVIELRCAFKIRRSVTSSSYVGGLWVSCVDGCVGWAGEVWGVRMCVVHVCVV